MYSSFCLSRPRLSRASWFRKIESTIRPTTRPTFFHLDLPAETSVLHEGMGDLLGVAVDGLSAAISSRTGTVLAVSSLSAAAAATRAWISSRTSASVGASVASRPFDVSM